jgi:Flp pilus assembly protein TadG
LPLLAGVLALVATLLIGLVALGNMVGDRARAQTAADAAALAGAAKGRPAAVAMAAENHGELESFAARQGEVEVTVRVGDAEATSRARRQW